MEGTRFLQNIFKAYYPSYKAKHRLPLVHHKAAQALINCRTKMMDSSVYECREDHELAFINHSCRHRNCPTCAARKQQHWLDQQRQKILPCTHYHMVFTLPQEYRILWQYNTAWFTRALFKATRDTLIELLADEKYLGVIPGLVMVLHTWGRQLNLHPHLHVLLTGGGLTPQGKWKQPETEFIVPIRVVKSLYRGKIQDLLMKAVSEGTLDFPPDHTQQSVIKTIKSLYEKSWSVRIEKPYPYGDGVLHYLSRYISGGPLKAQQIQSAGARHIIFSYKDHRSGTVKPLKLKRDEFIRRIFLHVMPANTHTVRHYGLYSSASQGLKLAKEQLPEQAQPEGMKKVASHEKSQVKCPCCGKEMVLIYHSREALKKGISYIKSFIPKQSARFVQQGAEHRRLETIPP